MDLNQKFEHALLSLDQVAAKKILEQYTGANKVQFIEQILVPVLENLGKKWEQGELALSQIYMSGRICEELMNALLPTTEPALTTQTTQPVLAITTLEDYHLLGKRMVLSCLRASGCPVVDLGRLTVEQAVSQVTEKNIALLLVSTLMLPAALKVKELRNQLDSKTKIIVGGAPFRIDNLLWQEVGADAMGRNAAEAIELVNQFILKHKGGVSQ